MTPRVSSGIWNSHALYHEHFGARFASHSG